MKILQQLFVVEWRLNGLCTVFNKICFNKVSIINRKKEFMEHYHIVFNNVFNIIMFGL
jgi:hypothetical protein